MMKYVIGGNWKMKRGIQDSIDVAKEMVNELEKYDNIEIFIAPSYTSLRDLAKIFEGTNIKLAAQNMHEKDKGSYTGEISPVWLKDCGCEYVILGHSERRRVYNESSERINEKVLKALEIGLKPVLCVGESAEERNNGQAEEINGTQLEVSLKEVSSEQIQNFVIAYEPVWAINSRALNPVGEIRAATRKEAEEMHNFIRNWLVNQYGDEIGNSIPLQYGGSVDKDNCKKFFTVDNINGGLVGTASIKATDFEPIVGTASELMK
ncbi:MAG: triose-phosphate isomerase [Candidatus Lokiarchaeota archaeon]|nr:triose-phosphate isomerase [Candidatus Lokiarchaeota archaeon]